MSDDTELLRCYVEERSEDAFADLVRRNVDLVYSVALRVVGGDVHLAEDVSQQVFSILARQAPAVFRRPRLAGWLYTTARFTAVRTVRSERRKRNREQEAFAMQEPESDVSMAVDWDQVRPVIDDVMVELGDRDREAVLLRFFKGQTFSEVGTKLGISEDSARMCVARALDKVRGRLARRGVTSTSAALGLALANQAVTAAPATLAASVTTGALASAAGVVGGTATAIGWMGFMESNKLAAGAAVMVLLALGVGSYELHASRTAETGLATERRELAALAARAEEAEWQAKALAAQVAQRQARRLPAIPAEPIPEVESMSPYGPNPAGSRARGRAMMDAYPEIQRLAVADKRDYFSRLYRRLYEELALTPVQIDAFEQIEISGVGSTLPVDGIGIVTLDAAPVLPPGEKKRRLLELLGDRGFQRFEEYTYSPDSRPAQLASALYFTDTPLTAEQGAQLQRVLAECNQRRPDQSPSQYWSEVRQQAAAFLAGPQLAALSGLQAGDEFKRAQAQYLQAKTAAQAAEAPPQ